MNSKQSDIQWDSIGAMFVERTRTFSESIAIIDGEDKLTYRQLFNAANKVSMRLAEIGLQKGDRVAFWAPNCWQWVAAAYGCWLQGYIVVPVSIRLKAMEVEPILQRISARVLFAVPEAVDLRLLDTLGERHSLASAAGREVQDFAGLTVIDLRDVELVNASAHGSEIGYVPCTVNSDDLAEVLFTSGTTGEPKGVQLRHDQLLRAYRDWSDIGGLKSGDHYLIIPPFSHGFGINAGIVASALCGMTMVLIDTFNSDRVLQLVARHKINIISGPPNLFTSLIDAVTRAPQDLSSLRVAFIGAANVPMEIISRVRAMLRVKRVINAYGLIEGCVVSMTREEDSEAIISTTVGRALPDVAVRIVDDTDVVVGSGQRGEIQVRGYGVTSGYWHDFAETSKSITANGWLRTGDIGELDADGNLRIVDRKKDMYICGGFNAYPGEIENMLMHFPGVSAASVVGVPDPSAGEVGVAFLVPTDGADISPSAVIEWARKSMANYKVPKFVYIQPSLPLNANGKVMKDRLRDEAIRIQSPLNEAS